MQLRQEFWELELLDDITDKYYRGKIMLLSSDYTRNFLIKAYREIQGLQYIPSSIHKAIRWSKSDPLLEGEADVKWHTTNEKQASNVVSQNTEKVNANKWKYDLIESSLKKQMSSCSRVVSPPSKTRKTDVSQDSANTHCDIPKGFIWSNNSCAYDSTMAILYHIWTSDQSQTKELFSDISPTFTNQLKQTFQGIEMDQQFEKHHDIFRYYLATIDPRNYSFGQLAGVDSLLDSLLTLENPIVQDLCRCPNGHIHEDHSEYSASFVAGTTVSDTIQDWIDL